MDGLCTDGNEDEDFRCIMVIAMASIMERMVHRMVRKCNSVDSANSKTESTARARASASDGEDKKKGDCG